MFTDYSKPEDIFPNPAKNPTLIYNTREKGIENASKAGLTVDYDVRVKGIAKDSTKLEKLNVFRAFESRDVAMAVEMLIHAYALVRYGKAIPSDNIKSGRSEFFLADAVRMPSMTALAYKKAKHLNYDAYKIGRHALKYIHDAGLKFPHDMKRNLGYMALRVLENEGFK